MISVLFGNGTMSCLVTLTDTHCKAHLRIVQKAGSEEAVWDTWTFTIVSLHSRTVGDKSHRQMN